MSVHLVLSLLGGLALFLYGMQMMSKDLESLAGNRMKDILEKLTATPLLGVLVGAGITAVIQSSSATTVMVVGFVNAELMTLRQAVWIIMGANIGTTITGQLIALDIGALAPLFAFVGVAMVMFAGKEKIKYLGGIIAGLGILFIGMNMMSDAMMPLRESERFISLMTKFSNPFFGIMSGMLFTAIIQSSSASVGILQALAVSGLIGLDGAVFVLFGQNIGTCITAVLASIGTNINARRTTIIHLMFNIIGTIVFTVICLVTPFTSWMISFVTDNPAAQIANVHTIFNITTTILLMPFGGRMAHAAELILPDQGAGGKKRDEDAWFDEIVATQHVLGVSAMAIQSLKDEVQVMLKLASENVEASFGAIERMGEGGIKEIEKREDAIDQMNVHLSRKVAKALTVEHGYGDVMSINHLFKIVGNIERIGDHAMNLAEYAVLIKEKDIHLSQEALDEVHQMKEVCMKALNELIDTRQLDRRQVLGEAVVFEQQIDDTNFQYRENQMERLRKGTCNVESSIIYSEMLTDYERIGDHILNIAKSYVML